MKNNEKRQCDCHPLPPTPFKGDSSDYCKVCGKKIKLFMETATKNSIHTPGPWSMDYLNANDKENEHFNIGPGKNSDGGVLDIVALVPIKDVHISEADAQRIVECVNAMEGIDDPAGFVLAHKAAIDLIKKEGNDFMKLAKLILKVKEDKRILLEALNGMKKLHLEQYEEGTIGNQCYKQMNEAIETASKKMSKEKLKS